MSAFGGLIAGFLVRVQVEELFDRAFSPVFLWTYDTMFHIYIICCVETGKRYIGQTSDLERRIIEHNDRIENPGKYTSKNAGTWLLIHSECFETRSAAMGREKWLKSGVGRSWINSRFGRACPPSAD